MGMNHFDNCFEVGYFFFIREICFAPLSEVRFSLIFQVVQIIIAC